MVALRRAEGARVVTAAALACALAACTEPRERPGGEGQHPAGWDDPKSRGFHALWLREQREIGKELAEIANCRKCHGDDYGGGGVGVSCATAGCHTEPGGPEACTTCHGTAKGPMPSSGAHEKHEAFCVDCHDVPQRLDAKNHVNGVVNLVLSGPAKLDGKKPSWDAETKRCTNVYCHGDSSPIWQKPASDETPCNFCHQTPPDNHARFARVATAESCATCHSKPAEPTIAGEHIDGSIEIHEPACDTCHGQGGNPAPGPSLDGSTDPTSPRVGAHQRHMLETVAGRIGRVVPCGSCHVVPASLGAKGHLDESAPADVVLPGSGTYDPVTQTCVVGCHFDKAPGPTWTDTSGAPRACGACHEFPPVVMRDGTIHTQAPAKLEACLACHPFAPETHVDGLVELLQ